MVNLRVTVALVPLSKTHGCVGQGTMSTLCMLSGPGGEEYVHINMCTRLHIK